MVVVTSFVAEQFLHGPDVRSNFEHMGRKAVSQGMWNGRLEDGCPREGHLESLIEMADEFLHLTDVRFFGTLGMNIHIPREDTRHQSALVGDRHVTTPLRGQFYARFNRR